MYQINSQQWADRSRIHRCNQVVYALIYWFLLKIKVDLDNSTCLGSHWRMHKQLLTVTVNLAQFLWTLTTEVTVRFLSKYLNLSNHDQSYYLPLKDVRLSRLAVLDNRKN